MLQPEVGDTVVVHFIVKEKDVGGYIRVRYSDGTNDRYVAREHIQEVIKKPWEPKPGDTVHFEGDIIPDFNYTVLAVAGSGRKLQNGEICRWVTAIHGDDKPRVFNILEVENVTT